ncbi:hypothetical protein WN48_07442 [Eufriesea mexicana]|uniref:Uncharacterized protein n=1 Tax=Eufriesea mexicana TaxID=516756 RepID=A0A310SU32_9HYME|nr:PREDICTED: uncharacterized protein LOC108550417 [Eufriesea mexicana]XP_017761779.1 PREDICTED: uncharacterized protein LOC108551946 [Eufriesea mexicana]OAD62188.1 hypothetical protein WN48_07442 [Eufriesea mexicana]
MLEETANGWMVGLYSFFEISQFTPIVSNLWDKETSSVQYINATKIKKLDVLLGYLILFWVILYLMYEKCLNSLLRRMRIPLMQRNRIIKAVWNCGFCFGSICYLKSPTIKTLNFVSEELEITHEELGVILHKSFYFHRAGIEILCNGAWTKGWANLLFASFIMNSYQKKWCTIVSTFLFYTAVNTIIIDTCRILLCISHYSGRKLSKLLFCLHGLSWIYLHALFVPKLMLWPENINYSRMQFGLWLWFTAECLDSVWFRLLGCVKATHWLEICLFPSPTREAIELAGIQKRHRDSLKKLVNRTSKKTELWQTLFCAVAIKKKIKRIRQAKQSNSIQVINSIEEKKEEKLIEIMETAEINKEQTNENIN